jgi:hypothetical protein
MSWSTADFANKARRQKVFDRLVQNGTMGKHWDPAKVEAAIEILYAKGERPALERLRSFCVPVREEIHNILGYDE